MKRLVLASLAVAVVGCSTVYMDPTEAQKMQPSTKAYPAGPYGYVANTRIANHMFTAKTDDNMSGIIDAGDTVKTIELADFYADKSIKALFVGVAAEWCGPCNAEQPGLVSLYKQYQPKGVQFIESMNQNVNFGPADFTVVDRWSARYKVPFPMAVDPNDALGPYYEQAAFPMDMVINMKDMTITWQSNGEDLPGLQAQLDMILAGS
jgi:thiol-disulfide isomerase/thioredoxin